MGCGAAKAREPSGTDPVTSPLRPVPVINPGGSLAHPEDVSNEKPTLRMFEPESRMPHQLPPDPVAQAHDRAHPATERSSERRRAPEPRSPTKPRPRPEDARRPVTEPPFFPMPYEPLTQAEVSKISRWIGDVRLAEHMWVPLPDVWGQPNHAAAQHAAAQQQKREITSRSSSRAQSDAEASFSESILGMTGRTQSSAQEPGTVTSLGRSRVNASFEQSFATGAESTTALWSAHAAQAAAAPPG
eukprot:TRINITY_DN5611_c2_g2_i2.p1 TRINITY_DN5611_c2_g2~~TRINITY_DN5611_c2_g2_i2.p1  ORF type:complete len:244 (+),score=47.44 TRINITY_DN5611_c2_g2_i2:237-968(+)